SGGPRLLRLDLIPILLDDVQPVGAVAGATPEGGACAAQLVGVVPGEAQLNGGRGRERGHGWPTSSSSAWACMTSTACNWKRPPLTGSSRPRLTRTRAVGRASGTSQATASAARSKVAGLGANRPRKAKRRRVSASSRSVLRLSRAATV